MAEIEQYIRDDDVIKLKETYCCGTCSEYNAARLVLLSCKCNSISSLSFLLDFCKLNEINIEIDYLDENSHGMFYYAIRSNNWKLLVTLIDEWPNQDFTKNSTYLYSLLSNSFNELKLRRVNLTDEMKCLLESRLLYLGSDFSYVQYASRLKTIVECIEYLNSLELNVNEQFLHTVEYIVKNIHILKQQIKSTYNIIPWEEMEFCLVIFLLSKNRQKHCNVYYCYTLSPDVILKHLNTFGNSLSKFLSECRNDDNINVLPSIQRSDAVKNIVECNPEFSNLYRDFWLVRDIYSFEKIDYYIQIAMATNPCNKEGQMIISRTLQVIGENLKTSLQSPKLSDLSVELLSLSLPHRTRQFMMEIRNKLSHSCIQYENNDLFKGLKNDLKKIGNSLTNLQQSMKLKLFISMLRKIEKLNDENKILYEINKIISCINKSIDDVKAMKHYIISEQQVLDEFPSIAETLPKNQMIDELVQLIHTEIKSASQINIDYYKSLLDLFKFFKCITDKMNCQQFGVTEVAGDTYKNLIKEYLSKNKNIWYLEDSLSKRHSSKEFKSKSSVGKNNRLIFYIGLLMKAVEIDSVSNIKFDEWFSRIFYLKFVHSTNVKSVISFWTKLTKNKSENNAIFISNQQPNRKTDEQILRLENVLEDKCFENEEQLLQRLQEYKNQKEFHVLLEVLLLDIMSSLESDSIKQDNALPLDNNHLLLTGKCLRNHLAHDNSLYKIMVPDINVTYILNAIHMRHLLDFKFHCRTQKLEIGLSDKFHQNVETIKIQNLMHQNLQNGELDELNKTLKLGADLLGYSFQQQSSLNFATKSNDIKIVKFTHEVVQKEININDGDCNGQTVLHISSSYGNASLVEFYLNLGANKNCKNAGGLTPLHLAALNGNLKSVELLIGRGAYGEQSVRSPLSLAVSKNHVEVVRYLLQKLKGFQGYPLHIAACNGHEDVLNLLLESGYDVNFTNTSWKSPLDEAAGNCQIEIIKLLLRKGANVNRKVAGWSALHYAAKSGCVEAVNLLLDNNCSIEDVMDCHDETPLHVAAMYGHTNIIEILIKRNATVDICDSKCVTPLHLAIIHKQTESALKLIENNADVKLQTKEGFTPLYYASQNNLCSVGQMIINRGVDVNELTGFEVAPMHGACATNNRPFVEMLLLNNANVNIKDYKGSTPLHLTSDVEIVELLLSRGADINATNNLGFTPLFNAVMHDSKDIVEFLIKSGAEVNAEDNLGKKPLSYAVKCGFEETADLLLINRAEVNFGNESLLSTALAENYIGMANKLLKYNANVNYIQKQLSMLQVATGFNQVSIMKALIQNGATDNGTALVDAIILGNLDSIKKLTQKKLKQNLNKPEILEMAIEKGDVSVLKYLITAGLDVTITLESGSALHLAAWKGFADVVKLLLDSGASVDCIDKEGQTPLHIACCQNQDEIIDILLQCNAQINVQDFSGKPPIHIAAMKGNINIVGKLIALNADLTIKDKIGSNLFHDAVYSGSDKLAKLLIKNRVDDKHVNDDGLKPIHIAIKLNHVNLVKHFLSNDELYQKDTNGQSLLHHAARRGSLKVLQFLIKEKSFDPNYFNDDNETALLTAYHGNEDVLKYLLQNGAYFDADCSGASAHNSTSYFEQIPNILTYTNNLFNAVRKNDIASMKAAIDKGAVVNCYSVKFGTPLHYASWKGFTRVASHLLDTNSVNSTDKNKCQPIHFAAKYSHSEIVKLLLSKGCVFCAVTGSNKTPLELTTSQPIINLLTLIEDLFCKVNNKDESVIIDLKSIKEIDIGKAVLNANNTHNKTITVVAFQKYMKCYEEMTFLFQENSHKLLEQARQFSSSEKHNEAIKIYKNILSDRNNIFGRNSPPCLIIQLCLADEYLFSKNYLMALNLLKDVGEWYKHYFGENSREYLKCSSFIALVLFKMGLTEDSLKMFDELFCTILFDDIDSKLEFFYTILFVDVDGTSPKHTWIRKTCDEFQESLDIRKLVFEKLKQKYGLYHVETVTAYYKYVVLLNISGDTSESLKAIEEVISIYTKLSGESHYTLRSKVLRVHLILKIDIEQALEQCYQLLETQKQILGEKHEDVIVTTCLLGNIHDKMYNTSEAYIYYKKALETARVSLDKDHPLIPEISQVFNFFQKTKNFLGEENGIKRISLNKQRQMMEAINNNKEDELIELIKDGLNINEKDIHGRTGLHLASINNNINSINILLDSGADITAETCFGETALHFAIKNKNCKIAELLLKKCPDHYLQEFINARMNKCLNTALHLACENNMFETVQLLLINGAKFDPFNVNIKKPINCTDDKNILHYLNIISNVFNSARYKTYECIDLLSHVSKNDKMLFDCIVGCRDSWNRSLGVVALKSDAKIAKQITTLSSGQTKDLE